MLGVNGIENLLDVNADIEAIRTLLSERPSTTTLPELPKLGDAAGASWANGLGEWFTAHNIDPPSKVAIANWLVENGKAVPSETGKALLAKAHTELAQAVGLGPQGAIADVHGSSN